MSSPLEQLLHADDQFNAEGEACGMPVSMQIDRLVRVLEESFGEDVVIHSTDLYGLPDIERELALDAVVAGTESPYVFAGGVLASAGTIDADTVLGVLRAAALAAGSRA